MILAPEFLTCVCVLSLKFHVFLTQKKKKVKLTLQNSLSDLI